MEFLISSIEYNIHILYVIHCIYITLNTLRIHNILRNKLKNVIII